MGLMTNNIGLLKKTVVSNNNNVFQILEYINSGKNGAVFKVYCVKGKLKGGIFALKVQYNLMEERLMRFYREVEFLKTHNSNAMVKYCDDGSIKLSNESYPFVVMPYYKYSLESFIVENYLDFDKKVDIAQQLLRSLIELDALKTVHRDIKPQNILSNGSKFVLADFGLVKNIQDSNVEPCSTDICGDISSSMPRYYRSPELVEYALGHEKCFRIETNIFQMGLVLSWVFTGINPLKETNDKLDKVEIKSIPRIEGDDKGEVRQIILQMISYKIEDRIRPLEAYSRLLIIGNQIERRKGLEIA